MEVKIPYGDSWTTIELPPSISLQVIRPHDVKNIDEEKAISEALNNPISSHSFNKFVKKAKEILLIVNDATRPTPTAKILKAIYPYLKDTKVKFLIATGAHRAPTEDECRFIFKEYYEEVRDKIIIHNARNKKDMIYIGKTTRKTEILINNIIERYEHIVVISSVEPHYFAGYTGGRKSFLPGITYFDTIEQNHKHALSPDAKPLSLNGNPVHEDMEDALKLINSKNIFSIQTVLNKEHNIYAVFAGDISKTFNLATQKANYVFVTHMDKKADIVVSIVRPPMDIDLYQSQKGIENARMVLKKGGTLILVSPCRLGIGDKTFFDLLSSSPTPLAAMEKVKEDYRLGYHKAARLAQLRMESEIWAITEIEDDILRSIFIRPFHSVEEALKEAIKKKGTDVRVAIILDGSLCVPIIEEGGIR